MITRKDFTKNDLCFYRSEDNYARKLGLQMLELLNTADDLPTARLIGATYSASYCHEPTVIFFDDDVLRGEPGLKIERGAEVGNGWIPMGIYHKIGFKYNNKKFEGWIYHGKLDPLSQFEKDELAQKYPEYFSEAKPVRGFFDESFVYGRDEFRLKPHTTFVTNTSNARWPLLDKGCFLESSSFFAVKGIDNIYTSQEIPCVGGFETGYYDPEDYEVTYEITREEDNTTYIVLRGTLENLKQYFYDAFETEDEDYNWEEYKPTEPPFKYPRLEYYNFYDDVPYDEITTSDIFNRGACHWGDADDDGTFTVEAIEKDINTPGAIIKFNGENVEMPVLTRGFFDEHLNEKIDRIWNSNAQIERVMEDDELSLDEKSQILFQRTPEHVFEFGMCSFYPTEAVRRIAEENGGTVNVHAPTTYLPSKGNVDVSTVMCLGNIDEPFNLQQSWDYYVKQRPSEYRNNKRRNYGFTPLNWYKYLKAVIEAFEEAAKYEPEPTYKRGFFSEGNQNNLREEMEKKVIGSGHGWRIICKKYSPVSWDRNRYKTGTVIVHLPHPGREYFMCSPVVTEGISGQPQLTFDDPAKAQEYCDKLNRISSTYRFEVSKTRADYECYKIPLGDRTEAWLATSNFPPQGSPKWKYLCDLFPDYFNNPVRGFFTESIGTNFTVDEVEAIMTSHMSGEEKSQKLFERPEDYVAHVQYLCFDVSTHNIEYLKEHNYLTQEALNISLTELKYRLTRVADRAASSSSPGTLEARGGVLGEYNPDSITALTVFYAGSFVDSLDKSWERYVYSKAQGYYWYKYIKHCINKIEESHLIQAQSSLKRGFFNESLSDGNPSDDEITEIINNDTLSDDEACEKLFGGRNQDYIHKACLSYCAWYKPAAPDGARTPQCYKIGVTSPFIINNFTEDPLNIRDSYRVYVEGKEINGESRWSRAKPRDWWESIVELYTFWEEHDSEHFTGPSNHLTRGFFDEDLKKEE